MKKLFVFFFHFYMCGMIPGGVMFLIISGWSLYTAVRDSVPAAPSSLAYLLVMSLMLYAALRSRTLGRFYGKARFVLPMLQLLFWTNAALMAGTTVFNLWADHEAISKTYAIGGMILAIAAVRLFASLLYTIYPFADQLREVWAEQPAHFPAYRTLFFWLFFATIFLAGIPGFSWNQDTLEAGGKGIATYAGRQLAEDEGNAYEWEARDIQVGIAAPREMRMLLWSVRDGDGRDVIIKVDGQAIRQVKLGVQAQAVTLSVPAVVEVVGVRRESEGQETAEGAGPQGDGQQDAEQSGTEQAGEPFGAGQLAADSPESGTPDSDQSDGKELDSVIPYAVKFAGALRNEAYFNWTSDTAGNVYTIRLE